MIDVANALIIVIDRDANVAVMNKAMQTLPRLRARDHRHAARARSASARRRPSRACRRCCSPACAASSTATARCRCGGARRRRSGAACSTPRSLRAPDGSIDGVIAIGQDVERMRSLERQVIQAEKLATLGQLAAGVVHELNNPLTSISVYGDYLVRKLERGGEQARPREAATRSSRARQRIQKLTRDLMQLRAAVGRVRVRCSLNDVVRQALVVLRARRASAARAEVELRSPTSCRACTPSARSSHQVLINLITNAIHALPAAGGRVTIGTELVEDGRAVHGARRATAASASRERPRRTCSSPSSRRRKTAREPDSGYRS